MTEDRWPIHPMQKKKKHFLLSISLVKKKKRIPLISPPPGESPGPIPRILEIPGLRSRSWNRFGMDFTSSLRRQACQMIKATYHLHPLGGSDVIKPCWFLELREVEGGLPRITIFMQAAFCGQDWPSTCRSPFLQNLAIPNTQAQTQWFPNTLDLLQHCFYAF